jgi:Pyruvate/2-oxoacid:ferredoxin oxidoreductase gamma subunit
MKMSQVSKGAVTMATWMLNALVSANYKYLQTAEYYLSVPVITKSNGSNVSESAAIDSA